MRVIKINLLKFCCLFWILLLSVYGAEEKQSTSTLTNDSITSLVRSIQAEVEELRGLKFIAPVSIRLVNDEEIRQHVQSALEVELASKSEADFNAVARFFGFLRNHINFRQTYLDLFSEQAAGIYDERSRQLLLTRSFMEDDFIARIIIAHELCHALQDQHFNLQSLLQSRRDNDDKFLALMAVIEGDATVLMNDYIVRRFTLKTLMSWAKLFTYDQQAFLTAPYFIQQTLVFPYIQGASFVNRALLSYEQAESRNMLFRFPPQSTEQVLHPEKYFSPGLRDEPTSITLPLLTQFLPDGNWELGMQNNLGELMLRSLFEQNEMREVAGEVVAGWDGDWYHLYRRKQGTDIKYLLIWRAMWDSEKDAQEFVREFFNLQMKLYPEANYKKEANHIVFSCDGLAGKLRWHNSVLDFWISDADASILSVAEEALKKYFVTDKKH